MKDEDTIRRELRRTQKLILSTPRIGLRISEWAKWYASGLIYALGDDDHFENPPSCELEELAKKVDI